MTLGIYLERITYCGCKTSPRTAANGYARRGSTSRKSFPIHLFCQGRATFDHLLSILFIFLPVY
jgi:hypothetical protein